MRRTDVAGVADEEESLEESLKNEVCLKLATSPLLNRGSGTKVKHPGTKIFEFKTAWYGTSCTGVAGMADKDESLEESLKNQGMRPPK